MNKLFILCLWTALLGLSSCSDKLDMRYGDRDAVYFQSFIYNSAGQKVDFDSLVYSFGNKPDEVISDTVRIVVCFNGRKEEMTRQYRVVVVDTGVVKKGKTTMEAGKDYNPIPELHTLPGNSWTDTLEVVIYREHMDASFRKKLNKCLILRLETSDDFRVGVVESSELKLVANNYLSQPQWWAEREEWFRYYHPEKLRALISFDSRFDVADGGLTVTNWEITSKYSGILRQYLNAARLIDPETNEYILMDEMVPVE